MTTSHRRLAPLLLVVLLAAATCGPARADKKPEKHYGLIYGTVFTPDARPFYGAKVKIQRADKKGPHWELFSDHEGEFAQRVPPGPTDYVVTAEAEVEKTVPGETHSKKDSRQKVRLHGEAKVHIEQEERVDIGVHLTE